MDETRRSTLQAQHPAAAFCPWGALTLPVLDTHVNASASLSSQMVVQSWNGERRKLFWFSLLFSDFCGWFCFVLRFFSALLRGDFLLPRVSPYIAPCVGLSPV